MTNLKNFAAQQLSKKQMNEVKGGYIIGTECVLELKDGGYIDLGTTKNADFETVEQVLQQNYESMGAVFCSPCLIE